MTQIRLYTNDVALETARQEKAAQSDKRLAVLRNRTARAGERRLALIAIVATARGDKTIATEARARLAEKLGLEKGFKMADVTSTVNSRRASRSKMAAQFVSVP